MADFVCIASGPSLTRDDVEAVRQWRGDERRVIVVNNTFRLAPWADALFAMDRAWWALNWQEAAEKFQGQRFAASPMPINWQVKHLARFNGFGNSGAAAVALAVRMGATRVVMLGYDCQHTGGRRHWHDDHPAPLGNAGTVERWPAKFEQLKRAMVGRAEIVNASRETALTMFPRVALEDALECEHLQTA